MIDVNQLPPEHKSVLFLTGAILWLRDAGVVNLEGGSYNSQGISNYDQLEASGYRPSPVEVAAALSMLRGRQFLNCDDRAATILQGLVSNWDDTKRTVKRYQEQKDDGK